MKRLYRLGVRAVRGLAPVLGRGDSKLARGVRGRRDAADALARWGADTRDRSRPTIWMHAPSVGEGLQARAVRDALKTMRPDLQFVFTFFSPSAERLAAAFGADVSAYLPWDLPTVVGPVLDAAEPCAVVFTKTEIWPELVAESARRGVVTAIVAATVPEGAGRARWPARALLRPSWALLDGAAACAQADAEGLGRLGVAPDRIRVTGDPGIDSAAARFAAAPADAPYLRALRDPGRRTLVAGSTWPSDEAVLLPALGTVRAGCPDLRVVIAPHEPTEPHVRGLVDELREGGWRASTLADVEASDSARGVDAVVVDRVGVLAHLYAVATASYVGGGFHDQGLHSVLEPAAAGSPVAFGPRHHNARAAGDLLDEGGAGVAHDAAGLAELLSGWLRDDDVRRRVGAAASDYIQRHLGAAARTAAHLLELIEFEA